MATSSLIRTLHNRNRIGIIEHEVKHNPELRNMAFGYWGLAMAPTASQRTDVVTIDTPTTSQVGCMLKNGRTKDPPWDLMPSFSADGEPNI